MDLKKIGKFIQGCRHKKNLTQEQLAEKLSITDRAVSKWERGLSLPDAGIMLELCNILGITVNELLNGEKIEMKDYQEKNEKLLLELARQDEEKNKKLIFAERIGVMISTTFYLGLILLASFTLEEGQLLSAIIFLATLIFVITALAWLKLEVDAGYYECKTCHDKFIPTYKEAAFAPHIGTTRYLKCPKCKKRGWTKKVMSK